MWNIFTVKYHNFLMLYKGTDKLEHWAAPLIWVMQDTVDLKVLLNIANSGI